MRYYGDVEFVIRTAEEWRSMPEDVLAANFAEFEKNLRAYHAQHAEHRKHEIRFAPSRCEV